MISKVYSAGLEGIEARVIEVEASAVKGLRAFNIVGLADTAIKEAKERVASAVKSIGLPAPQSQAKRVLINLAPADMKKQGALYDLPIAIAYLIASSQIIPCKTAQDKTGNKILFGELALDGKLKPIKGALSFALMAKEQGFDEIILPKANIKEAGLSILLKNKTDFKIIGANNLLEAVNHINGTEEIPEFQFNLAELQAEPNNFEIDLNWIKGQDFAKRGLIVAAAGGHNLIFHGPPGAGKTLLAKSIVSILPKLSAKELLELTKIYSSCGLLEQGSILLQRPFRAPHHSSSETSLIGGGTPPKPGEITLSHRGVLFLDEFPEFHRDALESFRQPMEEGKITIQRAKYNVTLPANFTLIAAANPCPCGFYNHPEKQCSCAPSQIASYRRKLSGPLMDRIDMHIHVPSLKYKDIVLEKPETKNNEARSKVKRAREIQKQRFASDNSNILTNSEMRIPEIKKYCEIDLNSRAILKKAVDAGELSVRGYHKILKIARTIADLDEKQNICFQDVSEALSYRKRQS